MSKPQMRRQWGPGGFSALSLSVMLAAAAALLMLGLSRAALGDWRSVMHQRVHTQAFETAEAALGWGLALLNDVRPVNAGCEPTSAAEPGASPDSFARRMQLAQRLGQRWVVSCLLDSRADEPAAWACNCSASPATMPGTAIGTITANAGTGIASAFELEIIGNAPGLMQVRACVPARMPCTVPHAQAIHQVVLSSDDQGRWRLVNGSWKDAP